ncbi:retrovirus-related pol polyprotein from transposon TNT 1-94, partial [Tanacetum coccineum]
NAGRQNRNQAANAGNGPVQQIDENNQNVKCVPRTKSNPGRENIQCYNCNARSHYAYDCLKHKVHDAKYFIEQMLLAMKDESGGTLKEEKKYFILDNAYGDETLEELTASIIMMARIQPADDNAETEPKFDAEAVSEVNTSHIDLISSMISKGVHEHTTHGKLKTVINTSDDDQIDCNIIVDDPYMTINAVNNGSNIVSVSCGKDVFMLSHEKCVARYALFVDSRVKRALFTFLVAAKSRNLGATSVVAKSRFSVAKIPTATNKRVLEAYGWYSSTAKKFHREIGTVRFENDHFTTITGYGDYV